MPNAERLLRVIRVCALTLGVGAALACARPRDTPGSGGSAMALALEIVGDSLVTTPDAAFTFMVRLRNAGSSPAGLSFPSSCSFTVSIATEDGQEVARPTPLCMTVMQEPTLAPGEQMEQSVEYSLGEPGVVRLAPGEYRVTPVLLGRSNVQVEVRTARLIVRAGAPESDAVTRTR